MKNVLSILSAIILFSSCEKVVQLDYKDNEPAIVIEANITNAAGPYSVKISKSISLEDTGAYPTIDDAAVTISDDAGNSEVLVPQGNGTYYTSAIAGVEGRTYTVNVNTGGQAYAAQSTMPKQVPFDSIKIQKSVFGGDTAYFLIPVYTDPVEPGNGYRFLLWVNNKLINLQLVQNDDVQNGLVNIIPLQVGDLEFFRGDTITVQMQCIDKNVLLYYTTLALIADSGPGGGTTPNNPPGNISNGALGIVSAYTTQTKTIIID